MNRRNKFFGKAHTVVNIFPNKKKTMKIMIWENFLLCEFPTGVIHVKFK